MQGKTDPAASAILRTGTVLDRATAAKLVLSAALVVALTALVGADPVSFHAFLVLAFVGAVPFSLWLRHSHGRQHRAAPFFVIDVLVATCIIHFTGGLSSHLCLLYPLLILSAGIIASGRLAMQLTVLSTICYATMAFLEKYGYLPFHGQDFDVYATLGVMLYTLFLRIMLFGFFTAVSLYLSDRCEYQSRHVRALRHVVDSIFQQVSVVFLVINRDNQVVVANTAARRLLGIETDELGTLPFNQLFADQCPQLDDPASINATWTMRHKNGSTIPCALEAAPIRAGETSVTQYVVAIWDLTSIMDRQQQSQERARLQTAAAMAGELAHWIRNPLAAIKLADEHMTTVLGQHNNSAAVSADELAMVASMCQVISEETTQLEERVNQFIRCTDAKDNDPALQDLVKQAEQWQDKLVSDSDSTPA